jgi:nitroreductase/dihydropteridine reductase
MNIHELLKWRYATKKMNGEKVPQEKVDYILEAARYAPSSAGLQPYEIIVITNKELLEKIKPIANNQSQITDASHLLVFAAWDGLTEARVNNVFDHAINERGLAANAFDDYKKRIHGMFSTKTVEEQVQYAAKQSYIALGAALLAAAEQQVDATPMEGFNPAALDELLGLKEKGLRSVTLLPLGYRDATNDWLVNQKKVRKPKHEFVTEIA